MFVLQKLDLDLPCKMQGNRSRFLSGEQRPGVVRPPPHVRSRCGPQQGETGGAEVAVVHMSHSGEHREPLSLCAACPQEAGGSAGFHRWLCFS